MNSLEEEVPVLGEEGSSHMSLDNGSLAPYQKSQPPKKGLVAGGRSGSETDVTEFTSAIYVLIFLRFFKAFSSCLKKKNQNLHLLQGTSFRHFYVPIVKLLKTYYHHLQDQLAQPF
jgi:hypothetical protein